MELDINNTKQLIKFLMKIILLALLAGVIAAAPQNTLKTRLGQKGAKNLAQTQIPALSAGDSGSCATDLGNNLGAEDMGLPTLDVSCPCNFK